VHQAPVIDICRKAAELLIWLETANAVHSQSDARQFLLDRRTYEWERNAPVMPRALLSPCCTVRAVVRSFSSTEDSFVAPCQ
jgi:hypothetical protein